MSLKLRRLNYATCALMSKMFPNLEALWISFVEGTLEGLSLPTKLKRLRLDFTPCTKQPDPTCILDQIIDNALENLRIIDKKDDAEFPWMISFLRRVPEMTSLRILELSMDPTTEVIAAMHHAVIANEYLHHVKWNWSDERGAETLDDAKKIVECDFWVYFNRKGRRPWRTLDISPSLVSTGIVTLMQEATYNLKGDYVPHDAHASMVFSALRWNAASIFSAPDDEMP